MKGLSEWNILDANYGKLVSKACFGTELWYAQSQNSNSFVWDDGTGTLILRWPGKQGEAWTVINRESGTLYFLQFC